MQRIPEPELMKDLEQVKAYANADFEQAHSDITKQFLRVFPRLEVVQNILDLGCGPADIAIRFAQMFSDCHVDAVDGSQEMLNLAQVTIQREALENRIRLYLYCLPNCQITPIHYDAIVSNSLLHHLHDPQHLWTTVTKFATEDTAIFISDLLRPSTQENAKQLVEEYAKDEPEILRRDFYNSLLAAFTIDEVQSQLKVANMQTLVAEQISDRHMIIYGNIL